MDFSILIILMSPFSVLGASGVIFIFILFFDENQVNKLKSLIWDAAASCGVTFGAIRFAYVLEKGRHAYMSSHPNISNTEYFV